MLAWRLRRYERAGQNIRTKAYNPFPVPAYRIPNPVELRYPDLNADAKQNKNSVE